MYNFDDFFDGLKAAIEARPNAEHLGYHLEILDDPSFEAGVIRYIHGINEPDKRSAMTAQMRSLRRLLEERREGCKFQKDFAIQAGMAGGVSLIVGSIIAVASGLSPFVLLIAMFGGASMVGTGYRIALNLDKERHKYEEMAIRMRDLLGEGK